MKHITMAHGIVLTLHKGGLSTVSCGTYDCSTIDEGRQLAGALVELLDKIGCDGGDGIKVATPVSAEPP